MILKNLFFYLGIFLLSIICLISCQQPRKQGSESTIEKEAKFVEVITDDYELYPPDSKIEAVLILFGGYPETAKDIKREFKILDIARDHNIAVILSNFNRKLWLEENEKHQLAESLQRIITDNKLPAEQIYIGGFSSGGVVSLLLSNYLTGNKEFQIHPKGTFIVDSPIDLTALYASSKKNVEHDFSEISVQESKGLVEMLDRNFGDPVKNIARYERKSVFTFGTRNTANLDQLKNTKIRLYTEPDTLWWKKNRMSDYDQTNAFYIKKLSENLKNKNYKHVEYLPTENRGYRANGERHPHSWAIVDKVDLVNWILEDSSTKNTK